MSLRELPEADRNAAASDRDDGAERSLAGMVSLPPGRALNICAELQGAILEHRLAPGDKLSEDEVGEAFGASRTVARAALQALAHTGLVAIERNRGAHVARPTRREANEVFEARALIEPRVARLAAEMVTDADIAVLRSHIRAEHDALESGDTGKALSLSGLFHVTVADIADQSVFSAMVRSLIARSSLIIALYWIRRDATCESHAHHAFIEALENGDRDDAEEVMRSHIVDLRSGLNLSENAPSTRSLAEKLGRAD